jgi:hypothetical protein
VELLFKIFIVPGALWIAYLIGLFAAIKMGGRDDIAGTYYAVITIPVALIAAGTLAFWLVGQHAFVGGTILTVVALHGSRRRYLRKRNERRRQRGDQP